MSQGQMNPCRKRADSYLIVDVGYRSFQVCSVSAMGSEEEEHLSGTHPIRLPPGPLLGTGGNGPVRPGTQMH